MLFISFQCKESLIAFCHDDIDRVLYSPFAEVLPAALSLIYYLFCRHTVKQNTAHMMFSSYSCLLIWRSKSKNYFHLQSSPSGLPESPFWVVRLNWIGNSTKTLHSCKEMGVPVIVLGKMPYWTCLFETVNCYTLYITFDYCFYSVEHLCACILLKWCCWATSWSRSKDTNRI